MKSICRFALLLACLAVPCAFAQSRGGEQDAKDAVAPLPDFSFCVTTFAVEGLKKEAYYTSIGKTGDVAAMKSMLEDFVRSGDNSMVSDMADMHTACATFHSESEALAARDRQTSEAHAAGFSLMPEFKY